MPCSKPTLSPFPEMRLPVTSAPLLLISTPSPSYLRPSCPLPLTTEPLSVVECASFMSSRPARALSSKTRLPDGDAVPDLIWMPTPARFVTAQRPIRMRLAPSTQISAGASASTVNSRNLMSCTPTSITGTVPAGAVSVTAPSP